MSIEEEWYGADYVEHGIGAPEKMKKIIERFRKASRAQSQRRKMSSNSYDDVYNGNGNLTLDAYVNDCFSAAVDAAHEVSYETCSPDDSACQSVTTTNTTLSVATQTNGTLNKTVTNGIMMPNDRRILTRVKLGSV